jgi:hypothetical protein
MFMKSSFVEATLPQHRMRAGTPAAMLEKLMFLSERLTVTL